jgi:nitrite reductase/ring-hydroxylating ferredoxin subunit
MARPTPFAPLIDAVENAEALDGIGKAAGKQVRSLVKQPAKDALAGTWLGHALHPMLTDVVIGTFLSATLLDVVGGDEDGEAGAKLIGIGMAAYLPTALSGVSDWADTEPVDDGIRRAGLVHAWSNATALALYALSRRARRHGNRGRARAFSLAGASALGAAGFLGGHLTFAKGVGPDQTVYDPGPDEWTEAATKLSEGEPTRVVVDDTPVLLLREGGSLYALHDRCSHRGCSLADGELDGLEVVCACHGSRFDLRDGSVKQGPATAPQPAFETRERDGRIEIRRTG